MSLSNSTDGLKIIFTLSGNLSYSGNSRLQITLFMKFFNWPDSTICVMYTSQTHFSKDLSYIHGEKFNM